MSCNRPPAEVYKILKPTMTALTMFEPMARMAGIPDDINLPEWVTACAKKEEDSYIERVD